MALELFSGRICYGVLHARLALDGAGGGLGVSWHRYDGDFNQSKIFGQIKHMQETAVNFLRFTAVFYIFIPIGGSKMSSNLYTKAMEKVAQKITDTLIEDIQSGNLVLEE